MTGEKAKASYKEAGVNIDSATRLLKLVKDYTRPTLRPEVLSGPGFFGGLFELKGYQNPVLVSSADGVGTKLKIATESGRYESIGIDLVNHCVNDILTCGAEPLFFLDYVAMGKLVNDQVGDIIKGLASACQSAGCALIGGETAEMPGLYAGRDFDLVGFIVGAVEKEAIIDGTAIRPADAIIGLPSSGLHTNGYSLVRRVLDVSNAGLNIFYQELGCTLGEELLKSHRCYLEQIKPLLPKIKGMAHITGGGLIDNIPRLFHSNLSAEVHLGSWDIPPIFKLIQLKGNIDDAEMYRVFNMGIGMVIICSPFDAKELLDQLPKARQIGEVGEDEQPVKLSNSS